MTDWAGYLAGYHERHAGITEDVLTTARDKHGLDPYAWLVSAVPDRPPRGSRVVDVGCGSAVLADRLSGWEYLGVDLSEAELTRARAAGRGSVVRGDARSLPVADRAVDGVVSAMALMLVDPPMAAVREAARVLAPGGTFTALVPGRGPLRRRDLPGLARLAWFAGGPGVMPAMLSALGWATLLEDAGLTEVRVDALRFEIVLADRSAARRAVFATYRPGRSEAASCAAAHRYARSTPLPTTLPLPLLRLRASSPRA